MERKAHNRKQFCLKRFLIMREVVKKCGNICLLLYLANLTKLFLAICLNGFGQRSKTNIMRKFSLCPPEGPDRFWFPSGVRFPRAQLSIFLILEPIKHLLQDFGCCPDKEDQNELFFMLHVRRETNQKVIKEDHQGIPWHKNYGFICQHFIQEWYNFYPEWIWEYASFLIFL